MQDHRTVVALPAEELDRLYRVCAPPFRQAWAKAGWQAILSCNASYEVWPTTRLGYNNKSVEREMLPLTDFPHLWQVVGRLLSEKPLGGRIFVSDDVGHYSPGAGKEALFNFGPIPQHVPIAAQIPLARRH